jgi:hypothetical protein
MRYEFISRLFYEILEYRFHQAGLLGVITRLRVMQAPLRDPPKSRLDIYFILHGFGQDSGKRT